MTRRLAKSLLALTALAPFALSSLTLAQADNPSAASPQTAAHDTPERRHALEVYRSGRLDEAMPLLESVAAQNSSDIQVREALAFSVLGYSATLTDLETRKKARARARFIALQAKQLGDNSPLLQMLLAIPEDGSEASFSNLKEVDEAMKSAEADFARGDWDKARGGYLRALLRDPNNYEATLFIGDTYFTQHANGSAGEWFALATQIDSNRETAYRYWGDALFEMGKSADARNKYIQAIIAEPYNQRSWVGLNNWARRTKVQLNWLRFEDKAKIIATQTGPTVTLDPSLLTEDPMFKPWLVYAGRRLEWQKAKFKQEFPNEPKYRHTLMEEADSLRSMVLALSQPEAAAKLDPSLAVLARISQSGFIEPFALLNRADAEIAIDYPAYRLAHRDEIFRYFDEFVVPKATSIDAAKQ